MRKITEAFKLKYDNIFAKLMNITVDELHFDKLKLNESICSNENAWQKHVTPESICKQMIDLYSFNNDDKILVLFNLELVKELIGRNIKKENIYFISDYSSKSEFLSKYFKEINYINLNEYSINDLEEKVKSFNVKKFDVVFSNPPYSGPRELANIDVKIFNEIINYTNKLIFIMPNACFISNLWINTRISHPDYIAQKKLNKLEKMIIINPNVFNGACSKENNLSIIYFNNNKLNFEFNYIDSKNNINKIINDKKYLNQFSSFDEKTCNMLGSLKEKIDIWLKNQNDFFINHANGGDYGRKPMNVKKLSECINSLKEYSFWLPCANGGSCQYFINENKNPWYCAINRGTEEHKNNNFYIEHSVDFIFNLGSARIIFNSSSKEERDRNWEFVTHSPIAKLIMTFYREDRVIYYKWFPWLSKNKSFNDLCNEIKITKDEITFLKEFYSENKVINWN